MSRSVLSPRENKGVSWVDWVVDVCEVIGEVIPEEVWGTAFIGDLGINHCS